MAADRDVPAPGKAPRWPHPYLWWGYLDDLDRVRRRVVGRFLGVPVAITPRWWLQVPLFFLIGLGLTVLPGRMPPGTDLLARAVDALRFMVAAVLANTVHGLGHVASGRLAGSPMDQLMITSTRDANVYHGDQSGHPPRTHLLRAIGGALGNAALAAVAYGLHALTGGQSALLARIAGVNAFVAVGALLPIPSVDGEVIWPQLARLLQGRRERP